MAHSDQVDPPEKRSPRVVWMKWALISIAVTAGLLVIVALGWSVFRPLLFPPADLDPGADPAVGKKFAKLELQPLTGDGEAVTLDDLAGRVVLVNFWATWCPPCREELPHLAEIEKKFSDNGDFQLLAVCHNGQKETIAEIREAARALLGEQGIDMPTYADPSGITRSALDQTVGFRSLPTTIILDRTGVIRGVWRGYSPGVEKGMEALITRLLAEG